MTKHKKEKTAKAANPRKPRKPKKEKTPEVTPPVIAEALPAHHTPLPASQPQVTSPSAAAETKNISHEQEALAAMKKNGIKQA